jgi:hypothetical protein
MLTRANTTRTTIITTSTRPSLLPQAPIAIPSTIYTTTTAPTTTTASQNKEKRRNV